MKTRTIIIKIHSNDTTPPPADRILPQPVAGQKNYFWYTCVAPNGETLNTSEIFPTRGNAMRAGRRLAKYADGASWAVSG